MTGTGLEVEANCASVMTFFVSGSVNLSLWTEIPLLALETCAVRSSREEAVYCSDLIDFERD